MMSVEENRKKVRRNNLLVSLLFLVMIIGVAGAVIFYRNLKLAKKTVQEQKHNVDSLNNILEKQNTRLELLVDTIILFKTQLDSIYKNSNVPNEIYKIQKNLDNILQPVITGRNRDSAREHARDGYDKLIAKDFKGAMVEFDKSEKFYNGYHESYEIKTLLKKNEDKLGDKEVQQQLLIKIKNEYNSLQKLNNRNIQ